MRLMLCRKIALPAINNAVGEITTQVRDLKHLTDQMKAAQHDFPYDKLVIF